MGNFPQRLTGFATLRHSSCIKSSRIQLPDVFRASERPWHSSCSIMSGVGAFTHRFMGEAGRTDPRGETGLGTAGGFENQLPGVKAARRGDLAAFTLFPAILRLTILPAGGHLLRESREIVLAAVILSLWSIVAAVPGPPSSRPAFETIRAVGYGRARLGMAPAQARLMAERAAQISASRNLLLKVGCEELAGTVATGRREAAGLLRGVRFSQTVFRRDGTATVVAEWRGPVGSSPCVTTTAPASAPASRPAP